MDAFQQLTSLYDEEDGPKPSRCRRSPPFQSIDYFDAIVTTDTRYFTDPSIAATALELVPEDLLNDLPTMDLLVKTSVFAICAFTRIRSTEPCTTTVIKQI